MVEGRVRLPPAPYPSKPIDPRKGGVKTQTQTPITIQQLAEKALGHPATTGQDYADAGLPMLGGCMVCGATIAAYNASPTKAGYLACTNGCAEQAGAWYDLDECYEAVLGPEDTTQGEDEILSEDWLLAHLPDGWTYDCQFDPMAFVITATDGKTLTIPLALLKGADWKA